MPTIPDICLNSTVQTWAQCDALVTQQQRYQAGYDAFAALVVAGALLLIVAYLGRHRARRAAASVLRFVDRCAYALGIDSRQVAARWRERSAR